MILNVISNFQQVFIKEGCYTSMYFLFIRIEYEVVLHLIHVSFMYFPLMGPFPSLYKHAPNAPRGVRYRFCLDRSHDPDPRKMKNR
jgi:hypothetical protein